MYQLRKKKKDLADSVAIYGQGRELFRPPTYLWTSAISRGKRLSSITKLYGAVLLFSHTSRCAGL